MGGYIKEDGIQNEVVLRLITYGVISASGLVQILLGIQNRNPVLPVIGLLICGVSTALFVRLVKTREPLAEI